ncbi:MAG TPA: FAD-dependent monooxygenase [Thermoanaerobaculia bacterium]|nr:FAD-dependent monooxygenase [Thermoanaerobaculia bacterium]
MTRVVIVGGGIGGIATALALEHHGVEHVVLEQAQRIGEVGAGIQLSPNGMRVLALLGVAGALEARAVEPSDHVFRDWRSGENLLTLPLGRAVRDAFDAPYLHAHRADLLDALVAALGGEGVRLGCRVAAVRQDAAGVEAVLDDGSIERGDLLIGADGIHSIVRDRVFAPEQPRASGYAAWRGLVPGERAAALGIERRSHIWLGPGRSVVLYYVSAGRKLNWVGIGPAAAAQRESWSATGSAERLVAEHAGWHPQIVELLAATERPFLTLLYDRHPLPSWVRGRVALLGDAAHAMLPYHAQGAVQSLEDAWVLASCLAEASVPSAGGARRVEALERYERLRRDRATQVQAYSRAAQDWYHLSDPEAIAHRAERFRRLARRGAAGFSSQQEWLYAYDADKAARGDDAEWRAMRWTAR